MQEGGAALDRHASKKDGKRYRVRWHLDDGGRGEQRRFLRAKDADAWMDDLKRRASLGHVHQDPPETFGVFFDGWLERYRLRSRRSTYDRVLETRGHLDEFRGMPLNRIRARAVEDAVYSVAGRAARQAELTLMKQIVASAKERGQAVDESILRIGRRSATSARRGSSPGRRSKTSQASPRRPTGTSSASRR